MEICKMHDLAVDILPPRSVDDVGKKQLRDQEEFGHAERQRDGDDSVQPAGPTAASTPGVECIIATKMMQKSFA
jgi:hypothetical protein